MLQSPTHSAPSPLPENHMGTGGLTTLIGFHSQLPCVLLNKAYTIFYIETENPFNGSTAIKHPVFLTQSTLSNSIKNEFVENGRI
jgi:hypothetical protein